MEFYPEHLGEEVIRALDSSTRPGVPGLPGLMPGMPMPLVGMPPAAHACENVPRHPFSCKVPGN